MTKAASTDLWCTPTLGRCTEWNCATRTMWTVISFGWNESTCVYDKVSEARTYFLRAKGIPATTYIDDACLAGPLDTKKQREHV